jgi:hypothetical protein
MGVMTKLLLIGKTHPEDLGIVPAFLDEEDPRPAREQFDEKYQHGGGWRPMDGFDNKNDHGGLLVLNYPGDPPLKPIAFMAFRDELVVFYPYGMVAIFQKGGDYEVARMD